MHALEIRQEIVRIGLNLVMKNLVQLTSGNVSARARDDLVAITPSSLAYEGLHAEDIVLVDLDGTKVEGVHLPSSEALMHLAIYRALPDVKAVVHTHSMFALAYAVAGKSVPVVCLEGVTIGGPIPVANYACPGTEAQGSVAVEALLGPPRVSGCLLKNHGLVATGATLDQAYTNAYKMELAAQVCYLATQLGTPHTLSSEQVEEILRVYQANTHTLA